MSGTRTPGPTSSRQPLDTIREDSNEPPLELDELASSTKAWAGAGPSKTDYKGKARIRGTSDYDDYLVETFQQALQQARQDMRADVEEILARSLSPASGKAEPREATVDRTPPREQLHVEQMRQTRAASPMHDVRPTPYQQQPPPFDGRQSVYGPRPFGSTFFRPMQPFPPAPAPQWDMNNPFSQRPPTSHQQAQYRQQRYLPQQQPSYEPLLYPPPPQPAPPMQQQQSFQSLPITPGPPDPPGPPGPPGPPDVPSNPPSQHGRLPHRSPEQSRHDYSKYIKPHLFHGRLGEDVEEWLERMEVFFYLSGTDDFAKVLMGYYQLRDEAYTWFRELVITHNAMSWTWVVFCQYFRWRHQEVINDSETLRDRLGVIRYKGAGICTDCATDPRYEHNGYVPCIHGPSASYMSREDPPISTTADRDPMQRNRSGEIIFSPLKKMLESTDSTSMVPSIKRNTWITCKAPTTLTFIPTTSPSRPIQNQNHH